MEVIKSGLFDLSGCVIRVNKFKLSTGSPAQGSDMGSDADGIPSEMTESSGNAEEMTPDLPVKVCHYSEFPQNT